MTKKRLFRGVALLCLCLGLIGCNKAEQAAESAGDAASKAGDAVGKAGDAAGKMASKAGETAGNAMDTAKKVVADFSSDAAMATTVTPAIKSAIVADPTLNDPSNKVDVDSKDKVVHLKGTVVTNDMKKQAEAVAKEQLKSMNAPADIKVMNQLQVQKR